MKTRVMARIAVLSALYVVLAYLTPIKLLSFKFTFEAFPILISGLFFGPLEGFLVGTIGSFVYQLLFSGYGLTITTVLWMLPHMVSGLIVGLYSKKYNLSLNTKQTIMITIVSCLSVTALNTLALYVDSKLFGYYTFTLVFGSIVIKIIAGIILAIIYSFILPKLSQTLKKIS